MTLTFTWFNNFLPYHMHNQTEVLYQTPHNSETCIPRNQATELKF